MRLGLEKLRPGRRMHCTTCRETKLHWLVKSKRKNGTEAEVWRCEHLMPRSAE